MCYSDVVAVEKLDGFGRVSARFAACASVPRPSLDSDICMKVAIFVRSSSGSSSSVADHALATALDICVGESVFNIG